jgi:hypothetical protein
MGVKTGFSFSLYIRGAYSPDLTAALYQHKEEVEAHQTNEKLSSRELEQVHHLKKVMSGEFRPSIMEIAATYAYLVHDLKMPSDEATIKLKQMKPFYSEADFAIAINRVKQLFIPQEN